MLVLSSYFFWVVLGLLCPLIDAKPQYQHYYDNYWPNQQQQQPMQFDYYNRPYSSFSDDIALLIQQSLPLHPFQKVLSDSQSQVQSNDNDDEFEKNRFLYFTVTYTETRHRGQVRTVYCTTSTKAISTCSPSGRRKRFSKGVRGLFYNEEQQQIKINDDSGALLHTFTSDEKNQEDKGHDVGDTGLLGTDLKNSVDRNTRDISIPYSSHDVQSGISTPIVPAGRILVLASTTVTTWKNEPRIYFSALTATCRSTTNYRTCGGIIYGGQGNYGGDWD